MTVHKRLTYLLMVLFISLVKATRYSACGDRNLREEPEGLIDPEVSLISFWEREKPVAILSFYATHPQSYYRTGIANPDFPGIARFLRQLEVPDALHLHFNGAGGNIAAGKYNDGSKINRWILAQRLADGMRRAWNATEKQAVSSVSVEWQFQPARLRPSDKSLEEVDKWEKTKEKEALPRIVSRVAYIQRYRDDVETDVTCLKIGKARIIGLPGECFVEFQLFAKKIRHDLFVTVAAYGDYGPGYIAPREAYKQGGYEVKSSFISPGASDTLVQVIASLLTNKVIRNLQKKSIIPEFKLIMQQQALLFHDFFRMEIRGKSRGCIRPPPLIFCHNKLGFQEMIKHMQM